MVGVEGLRGFVKSPKRRGSYGQKEPPIVSWKGSRFKHEYAY